MNDAKENEWNEPSAQGLPDPATRQLRGEIEQTRAGMSATIEALETRLNPQDLRGKVEAELQHVEAKVRDVVREHLSEAKSLVREELIEAKTLLRAEMDEAEEKVKKGLIEARDTVKNDLREELTGIESKLKQGLSEARDTVKADLQLAVAGAKRSLRAATVGKVEDLATNLGDAMNDTRDTLIETVRQNPLPAALAGLGLAWLLMNRSSSAKRARSGSGASYGGVDSGAYGSGPSGQRAFEHVGSAVRGAVRGAADTVGHLAHDATDAAAGAAHQASGALNGAIHDASDFVGHVAHQTTDAGSALLHGAADASSQLVHRAGDAATYVGDHALSGARRVERGLQSTLHESPLALGAAALAVGAAVGFSLPRTHGEDAFMGETRDRVIRRAGEAAHDAATAVGHLTEKTAESAKKALEGASSSAGSR